MPHQVKFIFNSTPQVKQEMTVDFDNFMDLDKFTMVYLLRYAININSDTFYKKLISIYDVGDYHNQGKHHWADHFLKLHFGNPALNLNLFIDLLRWKCIDKNQNVNSLLAGVHCSFK